MHYYDSKDRQFYSTVGVVSQSEALFPLGIELTAADISEVDTFSVGTFHGMFPLAESASRELGWRVENLPGTPVFRVIR